MDGALSMLCQRWARTKQTKFLSSDGDIMNILTRFIKLDFNYNNSVWMANEESSLNQCEASLISDVYFIWMDRTVISLLWGERILVTKFSTLKNSSVSRVPMKLVR